MGSYRTGGPGVKVHLAGPPAGIELRPWCGTRPSSDTHLLRISSDWDDVTCARCSKEVKRRRRSTRRSTIADRQAAQTRLPVDSDSRVAVGYDTAEIIDLAAERVRRRAAT